MRGKLTAYLQLIRLPNVLTAAADSLAGWLLVGGTLAEYPRWLPLICASMLLYAGGMALNDVFDFEIDRQERPSRPLPSGRASLKLAAGLGFGALLLGPLLASISGHTSSLVVAAVLAGAVLAYDAGLKRTILGPEVMGACRGLNMLLGMSQAPALGGPTAWACAFCFGLFVTGLTWISRSETVVGEKRNLLTGIAIQNLALLGLMAVAMRSREFPVPRTEQPLIPLEGLLVLCLVSFAVNLSASQALNQPTAALIQKTVKTGILSLVWIDAGLVAAVRGPSAAVAIAALWLPAYLLGRFLYST